MEQLAAALGWLPMRERQPLPGSGQTRTSWLSLARELATERLCRPGSTAQQDVGRDGRHLVTSLLFSYLPRVLAS